MKKITAILLAALLSVLTFFGSAPVAFAASYNGVCGDNLTWNLDTLSGTLTISGTGAMTAYSADVMPEWNRYQGYIKSVVFADGVTQVGAYAFYNGGNGYKYKKLTQIDLGNTVASIGAYAFRGCSAVTAVSGGDAVTAVGNYAFRSCTALASVSIGNVQTIGNGAFSYCTALADFSLPNSVRTIGASVFLACESLQSVILGTALTSIGVKAFADCTGLVTVLYRPVSYEGTDASAFSGAGAVGGMQVVFADTVKIVPAGVFSCCENLTSVTLGSAVTTISENAFSHTGLRSLYLPKTVTSVSATAFNGCTSMTQFTVDSENPSFYAGTNGILLNKAQSAIIRFPCGKTNTVYVVPSTISVIGASAFRECLHLTRILMPSGVTVIGSYAFADCENIQAATLTSVTTISNNAFADCNALETLTMSRVTTIGDHAFFGCDTLYSVTMPSTLRTISPYAFANCAALTNVTLNQGLTLIGSYAFHFDKSLAAIDIPSTVASIGEGAFYYCETLASVTLEDGVGAIETIAFLHCLALQSIRVPSSVNRIGKNALGCYRVNNGVAPISGFTIYCEIDSVAYQYASNVAAFQVITDSASEFTPDAATADGGFDGAAQTVIHVAEQAAAQIGLSDWFAQIQSLCRRIVEVIRGMAILRK